MTSLVKSNDLTKMDPYITKISYAQVDQIRPINGIRFVEKLEKSFGTEKVTQAFRNILTQSDATFSGVRAFKDRVIEALLGKVRLEGMDQIYILKYVQSI